MHHRQDGNEKKKNTGKERYQEIEKKIERRGKSLCSLKRRQREKGGIIEFTDGWYTSLLQEQDVALW